MPSNLSSRRLICTLLLMLLIAPPSHASAYNGRPRLIVILVLDQFRGDYLERYRDDFGAGGFRMLLDRAANFTDCYYDYANTRTAPGHATLGTGAYSNGHGIGANEWWDAKRNRVVSSVEDDSMQLLGGSGGVGASPFNLLADTLGDELRMATQGASRVFGVSLKDRSSILPTGFSANGAYWIDKSNGAIQTSTYYMKDLPPWVAEFNAAKRADAYLNKEWKDSSGNLLAKTQIRTNVNGMPDNFYDVVGPTPFAIEYQLEFTRELIAHEKLGSGPATDLLFVSISSTDILGHKVGPDSPLMKAMTLTLDKQLADFFAYLGKEIGLANIWIALSADHGIVPLPDATKKLHMPGANFSGGDLLLPLNVAISKKFPSKPANEYVKAAAWPFLFLSEDVFHAAGVNEPDAERMVGELLMQNPAVRGYHTRTQLAAGSMPADDLGRKYLHSYMAYGGWYTLAVPTPFFTDYSSGVDHLSPYAYDTHVPLILYGLPFQPGAYRTHTEPVDLAVTLASLLGINKPTHAVGRVLVEALAPQADLSRSSSSRVAQPLTSAAIAGDSR